jgi:hypothetical protein
MTDLEKEILGVLTELDHTAKSMSTAEPKPDLRPLFTRLDDLGRQLPKGSDPNLAHYLQRKSYEKARLLLEGRGV